MARSQRTIDLGIANKTVNNRGATLRQVAEHAGVSLATASYALGSGRRSVSEPTRRRVIDATQELGYQPRRRGRYGTSRLSIAAIVPDATNSFFSDTVRGIQEVVRSHGHRLVVASSEDDPDAEQDLVTYFRGKSDGLIMAPAGVVGPAVTDMDAGPVPVVLIDRDGAAPSISSVVMDNVGSAHRATRVLIESGHDRVAIINGPVSVNTARDRFTGFRRAMEEAGMPVRDEYVRSSDFSFEARPPRRPRPSNLECATSSYFLRQRAPYLRASIYFKGARAGVAGRRRRRRVWRCRLGLSSQASHHGRRTACSGAGPNGSPSAVGAETGPPHFSAHRPR